MELLISNSIGRPDSQHLSRLWSMAGIRITAETCLRLYAHALKQSAKKDLILGVFQRYVDKRELSNCVGLQQPIIDTPWKMLGNATLCSFSFDVRQKEAQYFFKMLIKLVKEENWLNYLTNNRECVERYNVFRTYGQLLALMTFGTRIPKLHSAKMPLLFIELLDEWFTVCLVTCPNLP
jgi:hypothetical protein